MTANRPPLNLAAPVNRGNVTLVEAGAGTGKTYNLARLYVKLLLEEELEAKKILTVTFTNAATEELAVRIRELVRRMLGLFAGTQDAEDAFDAHIQRTFAGHEDRARELLKRALADIDEASIHTIHAFCQRTLQQAAFESGALFSLEPLADESELILETARDYWREHLYHASPAIVSAVRAAGITPESMVTQFGLYRRTPDTAVLPGAPEFSAACGVLDELQQMMGREFAGELDAVRALIQDSKGLAKNAKTYNDTRLNEIFTDLASFFADGTLRSLDSVAMLTPDALRENRTPTGVKKGIEPPEHALFDACARAVPVLQQVAAAFGAGYLDGAEAALKRKMIAGRHMSYHDMLVDLYRALQADTRQVGIVKLLRDKYEAALVDEFQDTDPVQYGIFGTVFTGRTVYLIGDPKQAIYRFRGADINTYLQAAADVDDARSLGTNWRSAPGMVAAVNRLFSRVPDAFAGEGIAYADVAAGKSAHDVLECPDTDGAVAPLQFMFMPWHDTDKDGRQKMRPKGAVDRDLLPFMAEEIKKLCRGGYRIKGKDVCPGDIAVLTRTGAQGAAVQHELRRHRVHSVLLTDRTVFETREMQELLQLLSAVAAPGDERLVRGALTGGLWGMAPGELEALQENPDGWGRILALFTGWNGVWEQYGVMDVVVRFMAHTDAAGRLLRCADGERRYANLLQAAEVLGNAAAEGKRSAGELLQWVRSCIATPETDREYLQLRLESDADAVKIVTVHRSKGLEFPVVFCPDLWRTFGEDEAPFVFHEGRRAALVAGPYDGVDGAALAADRERLAEDLRLVYVALTRARYRCYVADGPLADEYPRSALAWLLHRGADDPADALAWLRSAGGRRPATGGLQHDLEAICRESGTACVRIVEKPVDSGVLTLAHSDTAVEPVVRQVADPSRLHAWRISSFSGLAAGRYRGRDKEEVPGVEAEPGNGTLAASEAPAHGIFAFPRGAGPGSALHEVFEDICFADADNKSIADAVARALYKYGIHESYNNDVVKCIILIISSDILGDSRKSLKLIGNDDCLKELEFLYPLKALDPAALNTVLDRLYPGGGDGITAAWNRLEFNPLAGYIRGFIDLVACWDGKYYILDWKSNHLGNRPEDYGRAQMEAAMQEHHYVLQYLLYIVALDRFLAGRIPGYSYDTHFGGVYYVFLRGVTGQGDTGWYFERPEEGVITELKELLMPAGLPAGGR